MVECISTSNIVFCRLDRCLGEFSSKKSICEPWPNENVIMIIKKQNSIRPVHQELLVQANSKSILKLLTDNGMTLLFLESWIA